jgi:spoIIIJ-associated protein
MLPTGIPFDPSLEPTVDGEGPTFGDAVRDAADQLGLEPDELSIEILDPGRSAESSAGFRPVKIRARRRPPQAAPDGARSVPSGGAMAPRSFERDRPDRGPRHRREGFSRHESSSFGPPPPPMDPSMITPEIVAMVRDLSAGIVESMEFPATVDAEKTSHGIRIAIDAGENDQYLIGKDGETLAAFQHLLGRMVRARMPEESPPRVEVDVAGFRDRQITKLREMARDLMDEVRRTGEEVTTEPLPASERRIVHLEVAENQGMETVTIGDGYYKRVVVRRATGKPQAGA